MQNQIIFGESKLKKYFWTFICGFQGPYAPLPSIALRQFFYQSLPRLIPIVFTRWGSLLFGTKPYFHPLVLCVFTVHYRIELQDEIRVQGEEIANLNQQPGSNKIMQAVIFAKKGLKKICKINKHEGSNNTMQGDIFSQNK